MPNEEIRQELTTAVESKAWNEMILFQQESEKLLDATLEMDCPVVAAQIEKSIMNMFPLFSIITKIH